MEVDLGSGFLLRFTAWAPDRSIEANRIRYENVSDVDKIGAIITCKHGLEGSVMFHIDEAHDNLFPEHAHWNVISWEPLTLEPSIQTGCCHGFIKNGRWIE